MHYKHGDVVLVSFVFSDETGEKRRPALVVSSDEYQIRRKEAVIMAITSRIHRRLFGDYLIGDWRGAGLLHPSIAAGIIRTINQDMINRKLGVMPDNDMRNIEDVIKGIFTG